MDWTSPFIVYRLAADGKFEEVFHAEDVQKAKYWLSYIAQPGDVLCRTPRHPKHSGTSKYPEYWSHKEKAGACSKESAWKKLIKDRGSPAFPQEQFKTPEF